MEAFSEYRGVPVWRNEGKFYCPMDGNIAYDTFGMACEAISEALDELDVNEVPDWMSRTKPKTPTIKLGSKMRVIDLREEE